MHSSAYPLMIDVDIGHFILNRSNVLLVNPWMVQASLPPNVARNSRTTWPCKAMVFICYFHFFSTYRQYTNEVLALLLKLGLPGAPPHLTSFFTLGHHNRFSCGVFGVSALCVASRCVCIVSMLAYCDGK